MRILQGLHSRPAHVVVLVASLLLVGFALAKHRLGANARSRFITVERVVDAGTLALDGTRFASTIDAVKINGKMYSTKPPLYTWLMIAEVWPMRHLPAARSTTASAST